MEGLICILEPDALTLRLIAEALEAEGFATVRLSEAAGALAVVKERRPDLVVLETYVESQDAGWTLLGMMRAYDETRDLPVIVCTSDVRGVENQAELLARAPETAVFIKPFEPEELISKIRAMLQPEDRLD